MIVGGKEGEVVGFLWGECEGQGPEILLSLGVIDEWVDDHFADFVDFFEEILQVFDGLDGVFLDRLLFGFGCGFADDSIEEGDELDLLEKLDDRSCVNARGFDEDFAQRFVFFELWVDFLRLSFASLTTARTSE